jgi:hypothetical protein
VKGKNMTPTPPYKVAEELQRAIVNLPCNVPSGYPFGSELCAGVYRQGHRDARHAAAELVVSALSASPALAPTDEAALRQFAEALIAVEPIVHYDAAPKGWNVHMADVAFDKYDAALAFARALLSRSPKVDTGTPSGDQNRGAKADSDA